MHELYKKYRPDGYGDLVGQAPAVKVLRGLLKKGLPHAMLLTGPSGCGKTTVARIIKNKLQCQDSDFVELNSASDRGIDVIRGIDGRMRLGGLLGGPRIWLFDECHRLTKDAQEAMLKYLEDTPSHVYFLLATTEPDKLITAIRTRCTEVRFAAIGHEEIGRAHV